MVNQGLIQLLVKEEDLVVPTLFKPVQFNVIKKIAKCKKLTENEKRYLRGKMKEKFRTLNELVSIRHERDEYTNFLNALSSYYITGLTALKHNGYGWYYEPKVIEVINTKIEGKLALKNVTLKFIRIKSISNSKRVTDKDTGLKYATNEQIIKDVSFTKNGYTRTVWIQMLARYRGLFVKNISKFNNLIPPYQKIDYSRYGV